MHTSTTELVCLAFAQSFLSHADLEQRWNNIQKNIGALLPNSYLPNSINNICMLDLLLRSFEQEYKTVREKYKKEPKSFPGFFHIQYMLSIQWVMTAYEVCRLLRQRKLICENRDDFLELTKDLELVRVPIAKYEFVGDRNLKEPVEILRAKPLFDSDKNLFYDKNDPLKAYMILFGYTKRGSIFWQTTDALKKVSYRFERLSLSNRMLDLWAPETDSESDNPRTPPTASARPAAAAPARTDAVKDV